MSKLRKIFTVSVMLMTVLSMSVIVAPTADAAASAGDLIKMDGLSSIYYLASDGKRYVFPNEQTYFSWYSDFSSVVTVSQSELESYPLGKNVTIRPGTKLIKITTNPKVYAVESNGKLSWVPSETIAKALYGDNWAKRIVDVADSFWNNYNETSGEVTATAYPEGSLVKFGGSADVYYIDANGEARKVANESAFSANRFNWNDVITSTLTMPETGTSISGSESDLTDTASGAGGTIATGGTGLTVALASDSPASSVIPSSASNVVLAKYNFSASSDGAITIEDITFKRTGVGATTEFKNLYIYDGETRLTNGRSVNSSTNLAIFSNVKYEVPAGATKTLSLVGDIAVSSSGTHAFEVTSASDVDTTATVSGSFPVKGNTMTLSATAVGRVVVTEGSDPANITAGGANQEISSFTLAVSSTEDSTVERVTLYQAGDVSNDQISNIVLKQNGNVIASVAEVDANSRIVLKFNTPFEITKGNSKKFYVYADLGSGARAAQYIRLYMDANSDVSAIGQTYNYPLTVAIGSTDSAGNATAGGTFDGSSSSAYTEATVEAGDITISINGPSASNVSNNSDDVALLNFSITAQTEAEIRSFQIEMHADNMGTGDFDRDQTSVTSSWLTDIKIRDTDTDDIVWGSVDLNDFSDAGAAVDAGVHYIFTDTVTFEAGVTRNFQITTDISSSMTGGSTLTVLIGDEVAANSLTSTAVKSTATNTYLTSIVPATYSAGNQMTIKAGALVLSRSTYVPLAQDVVKGATDVEAGSIAFSAATSGVDIKVTQIKLSGYVASNAGTYALTKDTTDSINVKDIVNNVRIYERASNGTLTQLGTTKSFNSSGEATFSSLNWIIPKESSKTLLVKADIASGISTILDYGTDDVARFAVDILVAADDVASETADKGTSITESGNSPNAANAATGAQVTIYEAGSVTITDATEPVSSLIVAGTNNVPMDQVKITSSYEDTIITKLRITATTVANLTSATITYPYNVAGDTKTATKEFNSSNADFTDLDIYVVKDKYIYVDVGGDFKTVVGGSTPGGNSTLEVIEDGGFEAVGVGGSSTKVTSATDGGVSAGNTMYIVKSKPTFTTVALDSTTLSGGVSQDIYKFTITADAGNDIAIKQLPFQVNVSDSDDGMYASAFRLQRIELNGTRSNLYASLMNITASGTGYPTSSSNGDLNVAWSTLGKMWGDNANSRTMAAIFDSSSTNSYTGATTGDSKGEEIISAGKTKTYALIATIGGTVSSGDSISVYMPTDVGTTFRKGPVKINGDDTGDNILDVGTEGNVADYIWSDNSSGTDHNANSIVGAGSSDWYNGSTFFSQTSAVSRSK